MRPSSTTSATAAAAELLTPGSPGTPGVPVPAGPVPRVALVGTHGYGARHLGNLARLSGLNLAELVSVADPRPPTEGALGAGVAEFSTLDELLAAGPAPDVVILATPIQTHAPLALAAIAAGADVYVEKPPMASMAQFNAVLGAADEAGRLVQVGFQSLGSHALPAIDRLVASGEIGEVRSVSATGTWVRSTGYFKRSRWAGKRSLDGTDVVDGVATNALAHAVATGLRIAGAAHAAHVASVETDLYRAHATESDDTSVIRVRTAAGTVLLCALTLCADEQAAPSVTVHGTRGQAQFFYTEDRLMLTTSDGERSETFGRTDLLENLLEERAGLGGSRRGDSRRGDSRGGDDGGSRGGRSGTNTGGLLSPLAGTGAFMTVLEAIRTAEPPREIGPDHVMWKGSGDDAHPVVRGIAQLVRRAAAAQTTFAELGVPWARPCPDPYPDPGLGPDTPKSGMDGTSSNDRTFTVDGKVVAREADGSGITPTSSPRPYLHPVTTLAGIVVTDHLPEDHVWHLGAGVAIQDVDGVNFWGGRTYTRDAGAYVWRKDHGRIITTAVEQDCTEQSAQARTESLSWLAPDGVPLLSERRKWSWAGVDPFIWRLTLDFELAPAGKDAVSLGSPGSNGRPQGGYGGFFWRLPTVRDARIWTADAEGEDAVHGSVPSAAAPWLAWTGNFGGAFGSRDAGSSGFGSATLDGGPATLVFVAPHTGAPYPADPWFVRMAGYPGVGLSLAWEHRLTTSHSNPVRRSVTVLVADGRLTTQDIEQLITSLGETV